MRRAPPPPLTAQRPCAIYKIKSASFARLVDEMRAENAQSRTEMQQLRQDLQSTRALLEHPGKPAAPSQSLRQQRRRRALPQHPPRRPRLRLEERVQKLEESTSLIGSKIDEQYQTKVESASKYRARLHGIVLMNAFRNVGGSDNLDFPTYSASVSPGTPQATFGATLRQSEIGLEIFGPSIAGAEPRPTCNSTSPEASLATGNGVNFGIVRLQTANLRFDWEHTSVVAGQDSLFISPLSPTSFASLATPAFAFGGNLWGWTPQLRVEHRFASPTSRPSPCRRESSTTSTGNPTNSFYRTAQAGEMSGQPAYAFRTPWSRPVREHPLSFGVAGYYGRQNWTWDRNVDAWAGMADWQIPLVPRSLSPVSSIAAAALAGWAAPLEPPSSTEVTHRPFSPIRGLDTAGDGAN